MAYYGSWKIDDLLTFGANTHRFDTGAATDADSVPSYRVYEDETSTPILTGNMALLDSSNTAGFYSEQITLSAANGFEKGKSYTVYIQATVNSVTGATHHNFQIEAEVDANSVSNLGANVITAASIATGAIDADAIADNAIDAGAIASDAITAAKIATGAIDADAIASDAITAAKIAADAITAAKIADGAIDAATFATGAITAAAIAADAIGASELAADAVTEIQSGLATAASIAALNNLSAAQVNTEVDTALADIRLDELLAADSDIDGATPPTVGSVFHELMSKTAGSFTFDQTTDSNEAIRDRGDAAWTTATLTAQNVWEYATRILTAGTNIVLAKGVGVTGFNDLSAAQVNTEVVDALNVDTYAEPGQEAPPATTTLAKKIGYLYKTLRNRKTQTSTTLSLYADDGTTVDQKATISDNGTTYDHGELGTGP